MLVTAHSISMISEAAATRKPVYVFELAGGNAKFAHFHEAMRAGGITTRSSGRIEPWSYSVPRDTAPACAVPRALVFGRRKRV
ncbi:MAG: mitochondrial fission ELM1 family protein [Alphaproteobacteria bacterium]|nr:mitochondrial fission ELM1 family protein [Alphaproteobacteria bacterium]